MQLQGETIIWNQPGTGARPAGLAPERDVFRLEKMAGDRINGSMPVWDKPKTVEENFAQTLAKAADPDKLQVSALTESSASKATSKDTSFGFGDFVDMINPLQHIPFISSVYRHLTGDEISPVSRVVGDAAFGGPIGAASGLVNALVQMETGKDVGENMIATLTPGDVAPASTPTETASLRLRARSAYNA